MLKTAQILTALSKIHKVVFVVDRKELDYQNIKKFNSFCEDNIDGTNNTNALVKQIAGSNKLIVTSIQKLNPAESKNRLLEKMEPRRDERIVYIFDEYHPSQFCKTRETIKNIFHHGQMFGFTGTPIFE